LRSHNNVTSSEFTEYQLKGAEVAAQSVDVAAAFPFTGGRLWAISGGLAVLAMSLFSVRYLLTESMSLRQSIVPLRLSEVLERTDKDSEETKRQREQALGSDKQGQKTSPKADGDKDAKSAPRDEPPPLAKADSAGAGQNPNQPSEASESKEAKDSQNKESKDGAGGNQQKSDGKQGDESGKTASSEKPSSDDKANSPKSSNGLIDRMKDALASLAAKMRTNEQSKQEQNQKQGEDKKGDSQSASKEQKSASRQDPNRDSSEQQQSSDGQTQGQTQEKTKSGQGKSADQSAEKSNSDAHSGIGSQDGDKSTKDAEQLKAMGKLAEIIGKRSASATGDVMVENPAGKQQLQTNYSQHLGQHADLGGEINRDEIPLMYQQYIREYMTQVRRLAKHSKPVQKTEE
jgi:hypothetical protein